MREVELFWTSSCGRIEIEFPDYDTVLDVAHVGDCEPSIIAALPKFKHVLDSISPELKKSVLDEMDLGDVQAENYDMYLIWMAANDLRDRENMEELCEWQGDFLAE